MRRLLFVVALAAATLMACAREPTGTVTIKVSVLDDPASATERIRTACKNARWVEIETYDAQGRMRPVTGDCRNVRAKQAEDEAD